MSKYYVHKCDRCGKEAKSEEDKFPTYWVVALISGGPASLSKTWCVTCWNNIAARIPEVRDGDI